MLPCHFLNYVNVVKFPLIAVTIGYTLGHVPCKAQMWKLAWQGQLKRDNGMALMTPKNTLYHTDIGYVGVAERGKSICGRKKAYSREPIPHKPQDKKP